MNKNEYVGIYGGSFDPPHLGHYFLVMSVLQRMDINHIVVVPSADHPEKEEQTSFEYRQQMCKLAFGNSNNIQVSDIENKLPKPNYTSETLKALKNRFILPLTFILGTDLAEEVPDWKKSENITNHADFTVVPRQGYPLMEPPDELGNFNYLDLGVQLPELSSSYIRHLLDRGTDVSNMLNKDVWRYIKKNKIYRS